MSSDQPKKEFLQTSYGRIAYLEAGDPQRPPVLFVHGIPTSSYLWRHVIAQLQREVFCLAPDLMGLGDTEIDIKKVPLHMDAQAEMLLEFVDTLGHERFSVVCHDQGGAAAQRLVTLVPERIDAFVITDCVCYDNWPVPAIAQLQAMMKIPVVPDIALRNGVFEWLETRTPFSKFRRGVKDRSKFSDEAILEYLRPLRESGTSRARFSAFLMAGHPRYSLQVVEGLKKFHRPTQILWAADDFYISPSWGRRLAEDIPGVEQFELIPFCGHFWQEERPSEFVSFMRPFLNKYAGLGLGGVPAKGEV